MEINLYQPKHESNYFKFLNSIIDKNEFKLNNYDSDDEIEQEQEGELINEQEIFFYDNKYDIQDIPSDFEEKIELKVKQKVELKPKSNFYKYLFSSVLIVTSVITVSYFFSKKRNKNKN
jgi:hypothetical protein